MAFSWTVTWTLSIHQSPQTLFSRAIKSLTCWTFSATRNISVFIWGHLPKLQLQSLRGNNLQASVDWPYKLISERNGKPHRPQLQLTRVAQSTGLCNNYHYLKSFHKEPLEEQGLKLESNDSPFSSIYIHKTPAAQQEGWESCAQLCCNYF